MKTYYTAANYEAARTAATAAGMTHRLDHSGRASSLRRASAARDLHPGDVTDSRSFSVPMRDYSGDRRTVTFVTLRPGAEPREGLVTRAQLAEFFAGLESVRP